MNRVKRPWLDFVCFEYGYVGMINLIQPRSIYPLFFVEFNQYLYPTQKRAGKPYKFTRSCLLLLLFGYLVIWLFGYRRRYSPNSCLRVSSIFLADTPAACAASRNDSAVILG